MTSLAGVEGGGGRLGGALQTERRPCVVQSVSAIAYPFDFRDFITITDASLYAI